MSIRLADISDLESILPIYAYAREQMRQNGNPDQWGTDWPSAERVSMDIQCRQLYVIEQNGQIDGIFAFIIGEEPTYQSMEPYIASPQEKAEKQFLNNVSLIVKRLSLLSASTLTAAIP